MAARYLWEEICSAGIAGLLFFLEMVKSRLICSDALASPCLPICFFTDFMTDMNCVGCQTFMTLSATFTMCLSQFELVYCSVRLGQERWRLFYGCTDDCLALCTGSNVPSFALKVTSQGLLMTSRAAHTLPSAALPPLSQGLGPLVTWSEKVLFLHLITPLFLSASKATFFCTFCRLSEGVIQKAAPVPTVDTAQVKNLLTSTHKKREQEVRKEQDVNDEGKHSPEGSNITKLAF